jgi:hypothetical protein
MPFLVSPWVGLLLVGAQTSMNAETPHRAATWNMLEEKKAPLRIMADFYFF